MLYTDKYYKYYYIVAYKKLLYATHQYNEVTGELIQFTDKAKLFYLHMLEQYNSYTKEGKDYYETQESLGSLFGVSDQQAYRVVNQLKALNLISVEKKGHRRFITTVNTLDKLSLILRWVNTKLEDKKAKVINDIKITSEQYLARKSNNSRWEQVEREIREEKSNPYINHNKKKINNIIERMRDYKEFQQWKDNKGEHQK